VVKKWYQYIGDMFLDEGGRTSSMRVLSTLVVIWGCYSKDVGMIGVGLGGKALQSFSER
jgi:hypothetical protein